MITMKTRRIDLHHHIGPDFYIEALKRNGVNEIVDGEPLPDWREEYMLDFMERFDIEAVVASLVAPGVDFPKIPNSREIAKSLSREINEGFARLKEKYNGWFEGLATLPANPDDALAEMEYCLDTLKLGGVALFSNYEGHYLGEDRFDELFNELNKRRAVVVMHPEVSCGGIVPADIGFTRHVLEFAFETTRAAFSLYCSPNQTLLKYPHVKVVLPHLGGTLPYSLCRAIGAIRVKEQPFDCKALNVAGLENLVNHFWFDTALVSSPWTFPSLLALVDTDKIVFGTDAGVNWKFSPLGNEHIVNELNLYFRGRKEDLERINYQNALDLFPQFKPLFE